MIRLVFKCVCMYCDEGVCLSEHAVLFFNFSFYVILAILCPYIALYYIWTLGHDVWLYGFVFLSVFMCVCQCVCVMTSLSPLLTPHVSGEPIRDPHSLTPHLTPTLMHLCVRVCVFVYFS